MSLSTPKLPNDIGPFPLISYLSENSDKSVVHKNVFPVVVLLSQLFDREHGHGFIQAPSINDLRYSVEYKSCPPTAAASPPGHCD